MSECLAIVEVDNVGRVELPMSLMQDLSWHFRTQVEIELNFEESAIVLRPIHPEK